MSIARLMQMARAGVPAGDVWTDPDLANASYDSVSFSVAGQEAQPLGLFFGKQGEKLYVTGLQGDDVNEYTLSQPWNISTASFVHSFSVSSQDTSPSGMFFKPDGTSFYLVGFGSDSVHEYSLSTAWNVATSSYVRSFSVSSQDTIPLDVFFSGDGVEMYVSGSSGDSVYRYSLGTPWDISTASYVSSFSVNAQATSPDGLFFSPNGDRMYVCGSGSLNEYNLTSAWDITTASYVREYVPSSQDSTPVSVYFKDDGSKMYLLGSATDTIYQYSTA